MSLNAEIGALLAALREKAKVTQSHIAGAMGKSQASLSRLEAGDIGATPEDYAAYLTALGTPDARAAQLLISTTWRHLPRPPLQHRGRSPWTHHCERPRRLRSTHLRFPAAEI